MIFDTDVLIWCSRGSRSAAELIESTTERSLSVISYLELIEGARDRDDLNGIKAFLTNNGFQMLPLSENIGNRAAIYMEEFHLNTGLDMGDALIAATAAENHLTLCTANRRHFQAVANLQLKIFRP